MRLITKLLFSLGLAFLVVTPTFAGKLTSVLVINKNCPPNFQLYTSAGKPPHMYIDFSVAPGASKRIWFPVQIQTVWIGAYDDNGRELGTDPLTSDTVSVEFELWADGYYCGGRDSYK